MALKLSELINSSYKDKVIKLAKKLRENDESSIMKLASQWSTIPGCTVNDSFYEVSQKREFNKDDIKKALSDLGIELHLVPRKKWYQFWKNSDDTQLLNAIKLIP